MDSRLGNTFKQMCTAVLGSVNTNAKVDLMLARIRLVALDNGLNLVAFKRQCDIRVGVPCGQGVMSSLNGFLYEFFYFISCSTSLCCF